MTTMRTKLPREVTGVLFDEAQFRFFKRFKAAGLPANQYGFFEINTPVIPLDESASLFRGEENAFVYFFYKKQMLFLNLTDALHELGSAYQRNLDTDESEVVFMFNTRFDTLVVISDDELNYKIFFKKV